MKMIKSKKSKIEELNRKINLANIYKKRLVNFKEDLNYRYNQGLITSKKYDSELNKPLKGRNLDEWLNYYNNYIKNNEEKILSSKNNFSINKKVLTLMLIY